MADPIDLIKPASVDILLIECPPWDVEMPPLGIAYLSQYLTTHGYKPYIFDLNIMLYNLVDVADKYLWEQKNYNWWIDKKLFEDTQKKLDGIAVELLGNLLKRIKASYIGLSVSFTGINFVIELLRIISHFNTDAKIIVGGWGCITAHMRGLFPKDLVDIFVLQEGEQTLLEIIESDKKQCGKKYIKGAIFKANEIEYEPRPCITDIDKIPWPTFEQFPLDKYKNKALPLFTSRGCISQCSFCNDWRFLKPYRSRSAKNIFEEIKYHKENNNISVFSFKDLLCNGNMKELESLCDLIIDSNLNISWDSQAIPRKEMDYRFLYKLKKAGCNTLIYGIESFSNNVLKDMKKIFTKEIAERVLEDTHKAGINTMVNIIVGFPGETEDDFEETVESIRRKRYYITQISAVSMCLVNNDTELDTNTQKYGIILPEDARIRAKEWYTFDKINTYESRKKRVEKILRLINQLELSYVTITT